MLKVGLFVLGLMVLAFGLMGLFAPDVFAHLEKQSFGWLVDFLGLLAFLGGIGGLAAAVFSRPFMTRNMAIIFLSVAGALCWLFLKSAEYAHASVVGKTFVGFTTGAMIGSGITVLVHAALLRSNGGAANHGPHA